MKFEVHTEWDNGGYSIELLSNGMVRYAEWDFQGAIISYPDDEPATGMCGDHDPYSSFVNTLNRVAKHYPEVYRAVYEHIQCRTEEVYAKLAEYCKIMNNQYIYINKFRIIE